MNAPTQPRVETPPEIKSTSFSFEGNDTNGFVVATMRCFPITNALIKSMKTKSILNLNAGSERRYSLYPKNIKKPAVIIVISPAHVARWKNSIRLRGSVSSLPSIHKSPCVSAVTTSASVIKTAVTCICNSGNVEIKSICKKYTPHLLISKCGVYPNSIN